MAIKLLGQVWKGAASAPDAPRRRLNEWGVKRREPSQWNPSSATTPDETPPPNDLLPADPVWSETQPSWHD